MTCCEICRKEVLRRKRFETRLVCWSCYYLMKYPSNAVYRVHQLEKQIKEYRENFHIRKPLIEYRFNSPFSAVPPIDILKNAILALDTVRNYSDGFTQVLSDYYGIQAPPYLNNPEKVPEGAIACYYPSKNVVYGAKQGGMSRRTALHEMWHALENFGIVPRTIDSEKNANIYAIACLKRIEQ